MFKLETEEMRSGDEVVFPHPREEMADGRVIQYAEEGINLRTYIAIHAMSAILSRVDGGIFNPDEVANTACIHAEAMLRRMP
jgi:hypothetical protein